MKKLLITSGLSLLFIQIVMISVPQVNDHNDDIFLSLLNEIRLSSGISPLIWEARLDTAANQHSEEMATLETLTHIGTDGLQFWQRVSNTGYPLILGAEDVLARGDNNVTEAFHQWLGSESHAANILNPAYQEVGFGVSVSASGRFYFTLILAAREDFIPVTLTSTPTATATLISTAIPPADTDIQTNLPSATAVLPTVTPIPTVIRVYPTALPTATLPPPVLVSMATIAAENRGTDQAFEIKLIYDSRSFTVLNVSDSPVYLTGLTFQGQAGAVDIGRWDTETMSASLEAFPSGGCLQVWSSGEGSVLNPPDECGVRHGWLAVNTGVFWQRASLFTVLRFGQPIANCQVSAGECFIDLDSQAEVANIISTTSNPQNASSGSTGNFDLLLVYDDNSFTVQNTSSAAIDLSGMGFASSSGLLSVTDWANGFLSTSLSDFPSGDCLQAWPLYLTEWPGKPSGCDIRHAWIAVSDTQTFWLNTDVFTVNQGGGVLATCRISAGRCEFNLP